MNANVCVRVCDSVNETNRYSTCDVLRQLLLSFSVGRWRYLSPSSPVVSLCEHHQTPIITRNPDEGDCVSSSSSFNMTSRLSGTSFHLTLGPLHPPASFLLHAHVTIFHGEKRERDGVLSLSLSRSLIANRNSITPGVGSPSR